MTTLNDEEREYERSPEVTSEDKQSGALSRWGGRAILALQSVYDKMLAGRLNQLQAQVIEQDREISQLAHDLAEMSTQVEQMNHRLSALEEEADGEEAPETNGE